MPSIMSKRIPSSTRLLLSQASIITILANSAQAVVLTVAEDASVVGQTSATLNQNGNTYRGGLFSGVDGIIGQDDPSRFYLKFHLPAYTAGTVISSATLTGYYNDDFNAADDRTHSFFLAANDAWTESGITWNNQPGTVGSALAVFNAAAVTPGTSLNWNITGAANGEYLGDGVLSILLRADDESLLASNANWEYFASKEYNPALAFQLSVTIAAVPEPTTTALVLLALSAGLLSNRRHKRSAAPLSPAPSSHSRSD